MIGLVPYSRAAEAVRSAHAVLAAAYLLAPGPLLSELEDAARRGARVAVRLEGRPFGERRSEVRALNRAAVRALRACGADARLVDTRGPGATLHMKALVCDGVAYLDDRNFPSGHRDTIVRVDSRADVDAVEAAIAGGTARQSRLFWTTKAQALAGEARVVQHARTQVLVETETFGTSSTLYAQLKRLAERGVDCRLLVSHTALDARTKRAVALLEDSGVRIRACTFNEKMAVADSERAWIGSANATSIYLNGDEIDWGLRTHDANIVHALRRRFDSEWRSAKPVSR